MRQPRPEDFGLTWSQVQTLDRVGPTHLWRAFWVGAALGTAIYLRLGLVGDDAGLAFSIWLGTIVVLWWLYAGWDRVGGVFSARIRGYARFRSARRAFDAWQERTRRDFWQGLSGRAFEHELASLFRTHGYEVQETPYSGDEGIDLVLQRAGRTTIVQCKCTRQPVG